ncbi:MAG: LexA family transcriptional regulator [Sphingobacteriales bacterium]|nr:MAG: LexA family transcriptional regulator [Sphingobacteriales bacterium]
MDANDYYLHSEPGIDLNEQLVRNKTTTYFMRVHSDAMSGAGIQEGAIVIVDRSLEPASGKVVIASVNGELLIRRLEKQGPHKARLLPASKLAPIALEHYSEKMIWGVVTYVINPV